MYSETEKVISTQMFLWCISLLSSFPSEKDLYYCNYWSLMKLSEFYAL